MGETEEWVEAVWVGDGAVEPVISTSCCGLRSVWKFGTNVAWAIGVCAGEGEDRWSPASPLCCAFSFSTQS